MESFEKMQSEIEKLVDESFVSYSAIQSISIGTHGGKNIFSKFRKNIELSQSELAAATTSLLFLAKNMVQKLLNQDVSYTITKGDKFILLCLMSNKITGSVLFDRTLVELKGFKEQKNIVRDLFFKISAIVETSDVIKEDLFVLIKRAIPNALSVAIISKEGLPIKVQSAMEEPKLSAFIYALHQLTNVIMKKKAEHTIINGEYGSIIILQVDEERILGVAVPESEDSKINKYIARLEEIIRELK